MATPNLTFQECLHIILELEGGYANHPLDPGGPTNWGITQGLYDAWTKVHRQERNSVYSIKQTHVTQIYHEQFWEPIKGELLPVGLNLAVFDCAVHSGPVQAIKILQRLVNLKADGMLGSRTLSAVNNAGIPLKELILQYNAARMKFLRTLRGWRTFARGWTKRLEKIEKACLTAIEPVSRVDPKLKPAPTQTPNAVSDERVKAHGARALLTPKNGAIASLMAVGETVKETFNQSWTVSPWLSVFCVTMWVASVAMVIVWLTYYSSEA